MKTIIKRELRNYIKNPVLWIGIAYMLFELFQLLNPYLQIHYFTSQQELDALPESRTDEDIMLGYVRATEEERMEYVYCNLEKELTDFFEISAEKVKPMVKEMREKNMTVQEMEEYLSGQGYDNIRYYVRELYWDSEFYKGSLQETNAYIEKNLAEHTFSYYFGRKFADFCGLLMGFFSAILLAFLFIRDTRKDMYELLHTKPVSSAGYICGKALGGFLVMVLVWGIFTVLFGALCEFYGRKNGFPVNILDFLKTAAFCVLPGMLMTVSIYAAVAMIFKNPLPAVPGMFLYMIYSNAGRKGADGLYDYYGNPLAIVVRFPGSFFETKLPQYIFLNQTFLLVVSAVLLVLASVIWNRRRVY